MDTDRENNLCTVTREIAQISAMSQNYLFAIPHSQTGCQSNIDTYRPTRVGWRYVRGGECQIAHNAIHSSFI
jgi:hypothetical protein